MRGMWWSARPCTRTGIPRRSILTGDGPVKNMDSFNVVEIIPNFASIALRKR